MKSSKFALEICILMLCLSLYSQENSLAAPVAASAEQVDTVPYSGQCSSATLPARKWYAGVALVGFNNGSPHSLFAHVTAPFPCPYPVITVQSYWDSILCGTTSGPARCINTPNSMSDDIQAGVQNVTSSGFDVFLSADSTVWVGATSPQFQIAYHVVCC